MEFLVTFWWLWKDMYGAFSFNFSFVHNVQRVQLHRLM